MSREQQRKVTINLLGKKVVVDKLWESNRDYMGVKGHDVACYIDDGVSVWPCGKMTDENEDDDCDCECKVCELVRRILFLPTDDAAKQKIRDAINHDSLKTMKTFVVDFGKGCIGGRYALIQASSLDEAWWAADDVGSPLSIAELKIPSVAGVRCLKFNVPKKAFDGANIDDLKWEKSSMVESIWAAIGAGNTLRRRKGSAD